MTYIEFFDKIASENIGACLTYTPDRIIYIGDNSKIMKKHIANYEKVFKARGNNIEFMFRTVSKSNLDNAIELLSEIVEAYNDCVFDVTGGDEMLILALGVVYAKHPDKNIQIHKFNLKNNTLYDYDKDGKTVFKNTPSLTVEENVRIFGGEVAYGNINEQKTYKWNLSTDFINDINLIWNICKNNVRCWNMQIGVLEAAEIVGTVSEDGLTTVAYCPAIDYHLAQFKSKYQSVRNIIESLLKFGLIKEFSENNDNNVTITYKNEQVKKCLTKAGQALEMKVYTLAKALRENDGTPVYNDVVNGVVIDWDGEFHNEAVEALYDTENEIDVLLMHGVVPVFVSCKNGAVSSDELYKLNTVAERFGGQYAKRVLVATALESMGESGKYIRQRAKDMNIKLVENVQELDDAEFAKKIKSLWNS